jgi:hypothetical protein
MILAYAFAYLYAFWMAYIAVMGIYRAHLDKRLDGVVKWACGPMIVVGIAMDVVANIILASVIFLEWPRELLVTTRLTRHMAYSTDWRYDVAATVCTNLLDVFDPTGKHCA